MNAKIYFAMGALLALPLLDCLAAPNYQARPSTSQIRSVPAEEIDIGGLVRQFKTSLADLKHEIGNHEAEIRMFEDKLHNQEAAFDHMQQQLTEDIQEQKDYSKASIINLDGKFEGVGKKLDSFENSIQGLMADLRQMKGQANESLSILGQYKQKLSEFDTIIEAQNLHMNNLEAALHAIMDVLQSKEAAVQETQVKASETNKIYKVQSGDTLEKIARANKVTLQQLKDSNQLTSDRIVIGQTLKIP